MLIKSFPQDSKITGYDGGKPIYDRKYTSADLRGVLKAQYLDGYVKGYGEDGKVTASGESVTVAPGAWMVQGTVCQSDSPVTLDLKAGKKHSVVVRLDTSDDARAVYIDLKAGEDYPGPTRVGTVYELVLAHVDGENVTDTREDRELCGRAKGTMDPRVIVQAGAETLAPGSDATASLEEVDGGLRLDLGIPKGEKGEKGDQGPAGETPPNASHTVHGLAITTNNYTSSSEDLSEVLTRKGANDMYLTLQRYADEHGGGKLTAVDLSGITQKDNDFNLTQEGAEAFAELNTGVFTNKTQVTFRCARIVQPDINPKDNGAIYTEKPSLAQITDVMIPPDALVTVAPYNVSGIIYFALRAQGYASWSPNPSFYSTYAQDILIVMNIGIGFQTTATGSAYCFVHGAKYSGALTSNLDVAGYQTVSVRNASSSSTGVMKPGVGLTAASDGVINANVYETAWSVSSTALTSPTAEYTGTTSGSGTLTVTGTLTTALTANEVCTITVTPPSGTGNTFIEPHASATLADGSMLSVSSSAKATKASCIINVSATQDLAAGTVVRIRLV